MKKLITNLSLLLITLTTFGQNVFINEINYMHPNANERGVEITGPIGTNLNNWTLNLYDKKGKVYHSESLSGTISTASGTHNTIWFPVAELHQKHDESIKLEDDNGTVVHEVEYGSNSYSNNNNVAHNKSLISLIQTDSTKSLQLTGIGWLGIDFLWSNTLTATPGAINIGQIFLFIPVKAIPVSQTIDDNGVLVSWNIPSTKNTDRFEIERSEDGIYFEGITTLFNPDIVAFQDRNVEVGKTYYYTINQIYLNGDKRNARVAMITIEEKTNILIGPNPIRTQDNLTIETDIDATLEFVMMDAMGKPIITQIFNDRKVTISTQHLLTGNYYYSIRQKGKIIKKGNLLVIQ